MGLLRAIAWLFLLTAVILLTNDVTRASGGDGPLLRPALSLWKDAAPASLAAVASFVQHRLVSQLWDPVMLRLLQLPAWVHIGAIGAIFGLIGRRRRRINVYAN